MCPILEHTPERNWLCITMSPLRDILRVCETHERYFPAPAYTRVRMRRRIIPRVRESKWVKLISKCFIRKALLALAR